MEAEETEAALETEALETEALETEALETEALAAAEVAEATAPSVGDGRVAGAMGRVLAKAFIAEEDEAGYVQPLNSWVRSLATNAPLPTVEASSASRSLPKRSAKKLNEEVTALAGDGLRWPQSNGPARGEEEGLAHTLGAVAKQGPPARSEASKSCD